MATFHYLQFRAFCHETEEPDKVGLALVNACQQEGVELDRDDLTGQHGNRISLMVAHVKNEPGARAFFAALQRDDPAGFDAIVRDVRDRVDDHLNLYLRLDKQAAFQGRVVLGGGDDAITVRGKLRSFAPKRDVAPGDLAVTLLEPFFGLFRHNA